MEFIKTIGDLKKKLDEFPDDLPFFVYARMFHSCCGRENCYCSTEYDEYEISSIGISEAVKEKKTKKWYDEGQKGRPKRVVLDLID